MKKILSIWELSKKKQEILFFVVITVIAFLVRVMCIKYISGDYRNFIEKWFYELKNNGGLFGLRLDIGNYNAPYLIFLALFTYLPIHPLISVKMFSIVFDYVCAFAMMEIVEELLKNNKNKKLFGLLTYAIVLFLPTVILNSAFWGQADSIYVAFVLISLLFLLKNKYVLSFVFLGISFAFKLQFIFILPLYVVMFLLERKFPWYYFLIIPLVNMIMCVPAILFGKSLFSCISVYFNQTMQYSEYISMNFPGVWNLVFDVPQVDNCIPVSDGNISKVGIFITMFIYVVIAFIMLYKKVKLDKKNIVEFALWSVMIATFFLPHMHDRYLFMGDILSILYYLYNRDKIYVPIGISLVSTYSYTVFLFGTTSIPIQLVSFMYLVLVIIVTKDIVKKYMHSNECNEC